MAKKARVKVHLEKHNSHEKRWINKDKKPVDWSSMGYEIFQIKT